MSAPQRRERHMMLNLAISSASLLCIITILPMALSAPTGKAVLRGSAAFSAPLSMPSLSSRQSQRSSCSRQPLFMPIPAPARRAAGALSGLVAQYRGRGRGGRMTRPTIQKGPPMNDEITFSEMRVVVANPDGKDEMMGVMSREEALALAEEKGVDLVMISPDAVPPVCKIINYDKLRYEQEKKEKMKRKNQKIVELKEVKLSYKIDVHDYDVRKRAAMKFLTKGDKVKATIRFRGREMAHKDLAQETLMRLCTDCEELCIVEKRPSIEGRMMQVIMAPNPETVRAAEKAKKAKSKVKGKKGEALIDADDESNDEEDDDMELEALNNEVSDDPEDDNEDQEPDYDIDELSIDRLSSLIVEVGVRIRSMKDAGKSKDVFAPSVDELLALKARYQEVAGKPWVPPE